MMKYGKAFGGADPELIEGDVFRIIIKVPEFGQYETRAQATPQVEAQVEIAILMAYEGTPLSSAEIASALGHKQLSGNLRKTLPRLREACLLEYTIPGKPNSRLQKYWLTEKGRVVLEAE